MTCGVQKMCNTTKTNGLNLAIMEQEPKDLKTAQVIIDELRNRCRTQAEQIMKWKKAYAIQVQQHYRYQKDKTDQMNNLTSQLLLLESRLKRKQKQIANIICHRELTIIRQQKLIDALSSRLVDHGLDTLDPSYTDFDSLNDSDSAVVLEDIDSDCNSSFSMRRKSSCGGGINSGDVTIVRSISDAIETNLNKYGGGCGGGGGRRSNCYLRRPDILETVYSVEEDPEPSTQQQQQQQQQDQHQQQQQQQLSQQQDVSEKRDKFRNRSDKAITDHYIDGLQTQCNTTDLYYKNFSSPPSPYHYHNIITENNCNSSSSTINKQQSQVTNFNRVMSNHRSVTKPKDVKYKRINKAKSKSLEELRGRLKNWVERGAVCSGNSNNSDNNKCSMNNINITGNSNNSGIGNNKISNSITDTNLPQIAQSYA